MNALEALMREMADDEDDKPLDILPEAKIARLREFREIFDAPNSFKPGDLVTIRKGAPINRAGDICIVLRSSDEHLGTSVPREGNWTDGALLNVIIGRVHPDGDTAPCAIPHWALEPYTEAS